MCGYHPCQSPVIPLLYLLWVHTLHMLLLSAINKHIPNIPFLMLTKLNPKNLPSQIECPHHSDPSNQSTNSINSCQHILWQLHNLFTYYTNYILSSPFLQMGKGKTILCTATSNFLALQFNYMNLETFITLFTVRLISLPLLLLLQTFWPLCLPLFFRCLLINGFFHYFWISMNSWERHQSWLLQSS